jgi:hypothetical protein
VVDLGILEVTYAGVAKKQHKINVAWQISELREDGKPFLVFKRYTLSLSEKATLRKDLESWRGKKFTRDEEMGFDVESIIGVNCLLNVTHNTVKDKVYANVASVTPLMKGMPTINAQGYVRKVDRTADDVPQTEPQPPMDITEDDIPF